MNKKKPKIIIALFFSFLLLISLGASCKKEKESEVNNNTNNNQVTNQDKDKNIDFKTISKGANSGFTEQKNYIVKNDSSWKTFWDKANENQITPQPLPYVDFKNEMIIIATLGEQSKGGFSIEITNVKKSDEDSINIFVQTKRPTGIATQALTQPYHIIKTDKVNKIDFINNK